MGLMSSWERIRERWMELGKLFAALSRAFFTLFPFLELSFLGLYIGSFLSAASTIVILIILFISLYVVPRLTRPVAWGILGFLMVNSYANMGQAMMMALLFAGMRFLPALTMKKLR
jgi:hypothetical protein